MNLSFRCLPTGALPYKDESLATRMMVRLFEKVPYLPLFPLAEKNDTLIHRTLDKIPGISIKEKKIILNDKSEKFAAFSDKMDAVYNNITDKELENFKIESFFTEKYYKILERIKPVETVVNFIGPFTLSQLISNKDKVQFLADKFYRKFIIQTLSLKIIWMIRKIKSISPSTTPVIILEEPQLNEFGVLKKGNELITRDVVINMFSKIFQNVHSEGGLIGIQSFNKCDWLIPIEAGADIISFDAYNNPSSLTIIPKQLKEFLDNGGCINWAIVPVMSESILKSLSIHNLQDRLIKTMRELIDSGVPHNLVYENSMVSIQGDVSELPLIFAEKALILSTQLADKIPKVL